MNHLSINWSVSHHHFSHLISIALERKKSKHLLLCFLFCLSFSQLLLSSCFSFSNSTKICSHGQSLTLLQLKKSFSIKNSYSDYFELFQLPSYPETDYWKEGSDCCPWEWVSCSWLSGTIHSNSALFRFPHLQRLNLTFNNFSGSSISAGFGRFSSLMHLNLSYLGFSGLISPEISHVSNLVSFDLSKNRGAEFARDGFDSLVQNLTKLQKLQLSGISTSSVFPNSLLNRSSLISLDLSLCGFQGRFLDNDIHLPKLELLSLWENSNLNGNFPRFSENNSLINLDLSFTNFSGELPASMGNLKSLQTLDLSDCQFFGSIPASLENLTQITSLSLDGNHFSGKIPNIFDNLRNLISLSLSWNNFSGQIPPSIGNLTNLYGLYFSHNQL